MGGGLTSSISFCFNSSPFLAVLVNETIKGYIENGKCTSLQTVEVVSCLSETVIHQDFYDVLKRVICNLDIDGGPLASKSLSGLLFCFRIFSVNVLTHKTCFSFKSLYFMRSANILSYFSCPSLTQAWFPLTMAEQQAHT